MYIIQCNKSEELQIIEEIWSFEPHNSLSILIKGKGGIYWNDCQMEGDRFSFPTSFQTFIYLLDFYISPVFPHGGAQGGVQYKAIQYTS